ncbi:hypothetical protein [uncultured Nostoc sp.]|uniref:hypothetical protein n=1 Tax=uncultured Nostoc sp. TaxID=340711 RepID=UPI0035C99D2F
MNISCFGSNTATSYALPKLSESNLVNTYVLSNSDRPVPVASLISYKCTIFSRSPVPVA